MDEGLAQQKDHLRGRLEAARAELERNRHTLEDENVRIADMQAVAVLREIDGGNLLIALRKLAGLEGPGAGAAAQGPMKMHAIGLPYRCDLIRSAAAVSTSRI